MCVFDLRFTGWVCSVHRESVWELLSSRCLLESCYFGGVWSDSSCDRSGDVQQRRLIQMDFGGHIIRKERMSNFFIFLKL